MDILIDLDSLFETYVPLITGIGGIILGSFWLIKHIIIMLKKDE